MAVLVVFCFVCFFNDDYDGISADSFAWVGLIGSEIWRRSLVIFVLRKFF